MDDNKAGMFIRPPSGSFTSWENTMCNPLGDMRTQTQSAWHDGYASAKMEREWQGLTPEEAKEISLANRPYVIDMIAALEKRLKEKNT